MVVWKQRKKGTGDLKAKVRQVCSISSGGEDCIVEVYRPEESEEEVTVLQVGTRQGGSSRSESYQEF